MSTHLFRPIFILLALLAISLAGCSSLPVTEPVRPPTVLFASSDLEIPSTARLVIAVRDGLSLTLPASSPINAGLSISIKNTATRLQIRATANDQIDDRNQILLQRNEAITVVADGQRRWHIIGEAK